MDMSWSQTPNKVWWALESSASLASLTGYGESLTSAQQHPRGFGRDNYNFYDYADEAELEEDEEQLGEWVREHSNRGIIRVYQPGSSYSELLKCTLETSAETIMARCLSKELFVHYGSSVVRRVQLDEFPLQLQNSFLEGIGHTNPHRIQLEGMKSDLSALLMFVAGQERGNRLEDRVQLACALRVKELSTLGMWAKRFCVLCGAKMFIFGAARPKGKPTLVMDLTGGSITEYKSKKHYYCLKICASRKEVVVAFESRLEQSKWLERATKVVSRHPLEANLVKCNLEKVPKYYFLNSNLVALNLTHNFMQESFDQTDGATLGHPRTIGWISDLAIFRHLVSLSLSDNDMDHFPVSLCTLQSLQELDISRNRIRVVPQEVRLLSNLTTLLLHSNQLNSLPYSLSELKRLTTLVIAFNKFVEVPDVIKNLPILTIFVASGNYISSIPEDIHRLQTLQHFDIRQNQIKTKLPRTMAEMRNLVRLNVRGNRIKELSTRRLLYLELLNCSENCLWSLSLNEGPMKTLIAKKNCITQFTVASTCDQLTCIDISKNELTSLPDAITQLNALEVLNASDNTLTRLPSGIFMMPHLQVLRVSNNYLVSLPPRVGDYCHLEHLDFHHNHLSLLPPRLLTKPNHLDVLNVSSNHLTSLPPLNHVVDKNNVRELYATDNKLTDEVLPIIAGYRNLKVLHLAYNKITNIYSGFFSQLMELEYVNLSGNALFSLPPILSCPRLRCLLLHSNKLSSLPDMPALKQLQTLDLSCNHFKIMPKLESFPNLSVLDLSGNISLVINSKDTEKLKNVPHCCLEGVGEASAVMGTHVETGGTTKHGKWSYGSAHVTGTASRLNCTTQLKVPSLYLRTDSLFAVMDGGRSSDAPEALRSILEGILGEELAYDDMEEVAGFQNMDPLQYLTHTFLTAHRQLDEIGHRYGASMVLCHIRALKDNVYVLNVANTGLGEAILCRSGRPVPLTTPHSPSTSIKERVRVMDAKGFISQDNRVNGVCGTTRLLGCYHLWPQVIPAPSTESVELRIGDEYIVLGTDSLWRFVTHDQVVHEMRNFPDPISAAKRLRDLAIAYGCERDVSVLVIKLNVFERGAPGSILKLRPQRTVPEPESTEDEEDDVQLTNIDDILSDTEEDTDPPNHGFGRVATVTSGFSPDELDEMILSAISTPPTSPILPTVKSTNIDDLLMENSPSALDSAITKLEQEYHHPGPAYTPKKKSHRHSHRHTQPAETVNYPVQTLPRDISGLRVKASPPLLNPPLKKDPFSFEQSQSVPALSDHRRHNSEGDPVDDHLALLNEAMSHLDTAANGPRNGTKLVRRLSYVEQSYHKLTNDTYSRSSLQPTSNTLDLDQWVWDSQNIGSDDYVL